MTCTSTRPPMRRRRARLFLAAVGTLVIVGLLPTIHASAASDDFDGDGISDALEDTLASRFFPWVWFDSGENTGCTSPASPTNPGTALARVRPHPHDPSKIAILYTVLFRVDCGDIFPPPPISWFVGGSHFGDVEPFSLTLAPNPSCPFGYGAFALKTIAHEGTAVEHIDNRALGNDCSWGRRAGGSPYVSRIYASENKHGLYASDESCDAGAVWADNCSESFTREYNVFNVGEDNRRRIDELSNYQFPGEYAWTNIPFRGSLGSGNGNAGPIRNKWIQDRLLALSFEPPPSARCAQPAHAWYETLGPTVTQGQSILLAAAGVTPNTVVSFHFMRNGTQVAYYQTRWAQSNCVVNQEYMQLNPAVFAPGHYQVHTLYSEPLLIVGPVTRVAFLMDLDVLAAPPPPPDPCYDEYGNYICPPEPCPGCPPIEQ